MLVRGCHGIYVSVLPVLILLFCPTAECTRNSRPCISTWGTYMSITLAGNFVFFPENPRFAVSSLLTWSCEVPIVYSMNNGIVSDGNHLLSSCLVWNDAVVHRDFLVYSMNNRTVSDFNFHLGLLGMKWLFTVTFRSILVVAWNVWHSCSSSNVVNARALIILTRRLHSTAAYWLVMYFLR